MKIKIEKLDRSILLKIINLDEDESGAGLLYSNKDFIVYSRGPYHVYNGFQYFSPTLGDDYVELAEKKDRVINVYRGFENNSLRDVYLKKLLKLFTEYKKERLKDVYIFNIGEE